MTDGVNNPMRVDTSLLQGISAANQLAATAKSSSLKSTGTTTTFSSALKSASETKETTKPVEGANYAEITSGPRAGMYVNTGGGARDGEAFILVKRGDREDHIYGTGKDRKVITVGGEKSEKHDATDKSSSSSSGKVEKAPANETVKQVEGRAYADILTGKRNGLYLNTSGNVRDGQTFALVMKEGREFHIYGTGKDRQIIGLKKPDAPVDTGSTTSTDTSKATDTSKTTGDSTAGTVVTDNPTSSH
jgi:hypothetical protein